MIVVVIIIEHIPVKLLEDVIETLRHLIGDELHNLPDLIVADPSSLNTFGPRTAWRKKEHIARSEQFLSSVLIEDEPTVDFLTDTKRDPRRKIRLDAPRNDLRRRPLRRNQHVHPGRPPGLGDPHDAFLKILALTAQHQLRKFIDHHDQNRHLRGNSGPVFVALRHRRIRTAVILRELLYARFDKNMMPSLYLIRNPTQCGRHSFEIIDDRSNQMRQGFVIRELHDFRIKQNKSQLIRRKLEEQTHDERIHADRFARSGRTRNQQVRRLGQIENHRISRHVLAEHDRNRRMAFLPRIGLHHRA